MLAAMSSTLISPPDSGLLGLELAGAIRGSGFSSQLIHPLDGRYDGARRVWNGSVDRRPALIAQCATPYDVALVIAAAQARELPLAVRGGGHSMTGLGTCDGGIVADLSPMRAVVVDPAARTMRVGGGALLEDLARAGQAYGLAVPPGHVSHTGVGGITLGGGMGWYHRQLGLTIDHLLSAQVVTADGEIVEASQDVNPDLFWALRGGGGNFGVVTEFRFRASPLGPTVFSGMMVFEHARAAEAIHTSRAIVEAHPELMNWEILAVCPPAPPYPQHLYGEPVCLVVSTWTGDIEAGRRATEPLRRVGPATDLTGPQPYAAIQFIADNSAPPGLNFYGRSHWMREFGEPVVDAMVDAITDGTSPYRSVLCGRMGGAVAEVPAGATAFAHRDAHSVVWIVSAALDADPEPEFAWVRRTHEAATPWSTGGVYVNALDRGEEGRLRAAYPGATWERLQEIKNRWDPENVFRLNQNVPPSRS
jgi:FAD/FMN-containing dehydrogenase